MIYLWRIFYMRMCLFNLKEYKLIEEINYYNNYEN